ncbi:hypothetical protein, partial [Streptomyces sp. JJ38]|uniref:hypothetical protein n=1 Tax=Streptomyces sp. JJ38 TaxID=2738128 RepID=UPI001C571EA8
GRAPGHRHGPGAGRGGTLARGVLAREALARGRAGPRGSGVSAAWYRARAAVQPAARAHLPFRPLPARRRVSVAAPI